jgi:cytochrome c oxidase subunit II
VENKAKALDEELTINVTGLQFAWIFNYPELGVTSGELHVPSGRSVHLQMNANDVIHAFWVPEFRLKQDVIPGQQTELRFIPTKVGNYPVICAELCGSYHGAMKTRVLVQAPEDFDGWIQSQKIAATPEGLSGAVALQPADLSPDAFLAPYAQKIESTTGVMAETLQQLSDPDRHQHQHSMLDR